MAKINNLLENPIFTQEGVDNSKQFGRGSGNLLFIEFFISTNQYEAKGVTDRLIYEPKNSGEIASIYPFGFYCIDFQVNGKHKLKYHNFNKEVLNA